MQAVPALGARLGRSGDRWRGFGACRRGEGEAVAVVELVGGGGSVRSREREGAEGDRDGGRDTGEWREVQGVEGSAWHPRVPPAASR